MNVLEARRRLLGAGVYKKTVIGNPAIAQGSLARMYPGIEMQGWTEQDSTTGAQLINQDETVIGGLVGSTGNEFSSTDRIRTGLIRVEPNTTYIISGLSGFNIANSFAYDSEKTIVRLGAVTTTTTSTTLENEYYLRMSFSKPDQSDFTEEELQKLRKMLMFNKGVTALPYEPYTGGAPSPSPEYPQEIVSAGKYDEATGKYQYEVKLTGANLFDAEYFRTTLDWKPPADGNGYPYIPIYIGKGNTVTISTDGTPTEGLGFYCAIARTNKNTNNKVYTWLYHSNSADLIKTNVSFGVIEDDYIYFALNSGHDNIEKFLNAFTNFQIEISAQKTEYQPYKEQTVTLTADRPLTKWDRLEKRNGQWGWVYKSAEIVLDGTEIYVTGPGNYVSDFSSNCYTNISNMVSDGCTNAFMNRLSNIDYSWTLPDAIGFSKNLNQLHVRISNSDLGTTGESSASEITNAMKAYMAQQYEDGNPFIFWYETAEETFVPLTESEQESMNALHTFRPTTVLSNDAGCNMELTYKTKKSLEVAT